MQRLWLSRRLEVLREARQGRLALAFIAERAVMRGLQPKGV